MYGTPEGPQVTGVSHLFLQVSRTSIDLTPPTRANFCVDTPLEKPPRDRIRFENGANDSHIGTSGPPWRVRGQQEEGYVVVWNRIFIDFGVILGQVYIVVVVVVFFVL